MARQKKRGVNGFVYWLQAKRKAPATIVNHRLAARMWLAWCEDNEVEYLQATKDDMVAWLSDLAANGLAQSTVRLRLLSLRIFYTYLVEEKLAESNEAKLIPTGKQVSKPVEPYTASEISRMYLVCRNHQERGVLMLLVGCGLRRSEVYRVAKTALNRDSRTLSVLGKGNKYRLVRLEPAVMEAVEQALAFSERLCPGKSSEIVWRIVKRLAERAGIPGPHFPHRMRYTFAVEWCEAGGPESELMSILGHEDMTMTNHYSKAGRERRALRTMGTMNIVTRLLTDGSAGLDAAGS